MNSVNFEGPFELLQKLIDEAKKIPGLKMRPTNTAGTIALSSDGDAPGGPMSDERRRELLATIDMKPLAAK